MPQCHYGATPAPRLTPTPACSLPQGKLVNETRCLQCETVTSREEDFYDLSLEIDQNCSLTSCLRNFRWAGPGAWGLGCTPGGVSVMFVGMHCVCVCVCVAAVACPPAFAPLLPLLTACPCPAAAPAPAPARLLLLLPQLH
jgi:hypothetical protein